MSRRLVPALLIALAIVGCGGNKSSTTPTAPPPPSGPGWIRLLSNPSGVPVWLDGVPTSQRTPATVAMDAGAHTLGLRFLGYADTMVSRVVVSAVTETVTVSLRPLPGTPRTVTTWCTLPGYPTGLGCGPNGTLYAASQSPQVLAIYSSTGTLTGSLALPGSRPPGRLSVSSTGMAYLWHGTGNLDEGSIEKYSDAPSYLRDIAYIPSEPTWPHRSVPAVGAGDTLYVLTFFATSSAPYGFSQVLPHAYDARAGVGGWIGPPALTELGCARVLHRLVGTGPVGDTVWVTTPSGAVQASWTCGLDPVEALAVSAAGDIYVAGIASMVTVVRHYSIAGALLGEWEVGPWAATNEDFVAGMSTDEHGALYVASWVTHQVKKYEP